MTQIGWACLGAMPAPGEPPRHNNWPLTGRRPAPSPTAWTHEMIAVVIDSIATSKYGPASTKQPLERHRGAFSRARSTPDISSQPSPGCQLRYCENNANDKNQPVRATRLYRPPPDLRYIGTLLDDIAPNSTDSYASGRLTTGSPTHSTACLALKHSSTWSRQFTQPHLMTRTSLAIYNQRSPTTSCLPPNHRTLHCLFTVARILEQGSIPNNV